jgi:hypothetical protein
MNSFHTVYQLNKRWLFPVVLGLVTFGIYLYTVYPTVAPYRDSGDLALASYSLGIAHPPGYPLYTLGTKTVAAIFNSGNITYRINLFSCLFSAITVSLIVMILFKIVNDTGFALITSIAVTLLYLSSNAVWNLSLVSEMYTFNVFFAVLLLYLALYSDKTVYVYVISFLFALGLGNHQSLIFVFPGIVYLIYCNNKQLFFSTNTFKFICMASLFFLLGFTIYIFLPARAVTNPLLNWGNPVDWKKFVDVITRAGYGTTSLFENGQNPTRDMASALFELKMYFKLLINRLTLPGLILGLTGIIVFYGRVKRFIQSTAIIFIISGPLFFVWSNLQISDYTLAILEPNCIVPDTMFVIWIGLGLYYITNYLSVKLFKNVPLATLIIGILILSYPVYNFSQRLPVFNKRMNFIARDYSVNTFKSMMPGSALLAKSDTMYFSMNHLQVAEHIRQDTRVLVT